MEKKHRKNQETRTTIHCKICDITLDVNAWASHIAGKKHAKKLHLQEQQAVSVSPSGPIEHNLPLFPPHLPPYMMNENPHYLHPSVIRMLQGNPIIF